MAMSLVFHEPGCGKRALTMTPTLRLEFLQSPHSGVEAHEKETDGLPCSGEFCIGPSAVVILAQDEQSPTP